MWFKCGKELLNGAIMRALEKPTAWRDSRARDRKYLFLTLLAETAEDRANDLQDAEDLARIIDTTKKQAQIIWDVCIKHNALRKGPDGYGAKAWMIEKGILGDGRKPGATGGLGNAGGPGTPVTPQGKNFF